jgi:GTPase SAR1 family protein
VSQPNLGERYFANRERISQLVDGIAELAGDTGTALEDYLAKTAFEKELGAPFLFVVCGEINAGKSSLINGLIGHELCEVSGLPNTDKVIRYSYGPNERDVEVSPVFEECVRPIAFLRDFILVDTPGTNSTVKGFQETTDRFLLLADLILFVFPVDNPWGASTWNVISSLPAECHPRIAFIIQKSDQRDEKDIKITTEHMADLSMKRIGIVPRIFAVSGKKAFEAKTGRDFTRKDYIESGFPALEEFISTHVCDSPERHAFLKAWRKRSSAALRAIEDRIDEIDSILGDQNHFLGSLEDEIDAMREQLVSRLPSHLTGVAEIFQSEAVWVTRALRKSLGPLRSVFRIFAGDRTGSHTEALFIARLRAAVEEVAESDGADIVAACRSHWDRLGERVWEAIGVGLDEHEPIDERLSQARSRFVQRIGRAAHEAIGNLHVRKELELDLRRRNIALRSFTTTALTFLIAGATCGILDVPWLPMICCSIAALFILGGAFIAFLTRRRIARDFMFSLLDTCGAFAEALRADYEEALRIFFQEYTTGLNSIRQHLAKEKNVTEPKRNRWHKLFLTMTSIQQDL